MKGELDSGGVAAIRSMREAQFHQAAVRTDFQKANHG